jgi:hypothetical protein
MYYLWLKQKGEGCDFMVGCGERLIPLNTLDLDLARLKAQNQILERVHAECVFENAFIVGVEADISKDCDIIARKKNDTKNSQNIDEQIRDLRAKADELERLSLTLSKKGNN